MGAAAWFGYEGWITHLHEENPAFLLRRREYRHVRSIWKSDDIVEVEGKFLPGACCHVGGVGEK